MRPPDAFCVSLARTDPHTLTTGRTPPMSSKPQETRPTDLGAMHNKYGFRLARLQQRRNYHSEVVWKECNAILDDQQKNRRPVRKAAHLFADHAFCDCGSKMYVSANSPKYVCQKCRNKIRVTDLKRVFHHQFRASSCRRPGSPATSPGFRERGNKEAQHRQ